MLPFVSLSIFVRLMINILRIHLQIYHLCHFWRCLMVDFSFCYGLYFPISLNAWYVWFDVHMVNFTRLSTGLGYIPFSSVGFFVVVVFQGCLDQFDSFEACFGIC